MTISPHLPHLQVKTALPPKYISDSFPAFHFYCPQSNQATSHPNYCKTSFLASSNAPLMLTLPMFLLSSDLFHTAARTLFLKTQSSHKPLLLETLPWLPIPAWKKVKYLPMAIKAMVNGRPPTSLNSSHAILSLPSCFPATWTFPAFSILFCALELSHMPFSLL